MKKKIACIVPAFNESECVEELATRLAKVFDAESAYDFEAIIVENGSTDDTMDKLLKIHEADPRFKILQLARNFGMDGGLTAGLNVSRRRRRRANDRRPAGPARVHPEYDPQMGGGRREHLRSGYRPAWNRTYPQR